MTFYWMRGAVFAWLACLSSPEADQGDAPARHHSVIERFLIEGSAIARPPPARGTAIDRSEWPIGALDEEGDSDESEDEPPRDEMPLRDELEVLP